VGESPEHGELAVQEAQRRFDRAAFEPARHGGYVEGGGDLVGATSGDGVVVLAILALGGLPPGRSTGGRPPTLGDVERDRAERAAQLFAQVGIPLADLGD